MSFRFGAPPRAKKLVLKKRFSRVREANSRALLVAENVRERIEKQ
jgi:hypothetical protein